MTPNERHELESADVALAHSLAIAQELVDAGRTSEACEYLSEYVLPVLESRAGVKPSRWPLGLPLTVDDEGRRS